MRSSSQSGFTVAEVFIALAMLLGAGFLIYNQWQYFSLVERNADRRTAINAVHYYLQEVYEPQHGGYPVMLQTDDISAIEGDHLRDPAGRLVTEFQSDLRYEPGSCSEGVCQRYTLRANLEQATDFIRRSD